jgi:hypothetical protein
LAAGHASEVVMASKTVVCPECGGAAAPGRYACPECGALLASVALAGRARSAAPDPDADTAMIDALVVDPPRARRGAGRGQAAGTAVRTAPAGVAAAEPAEHAVPAAAAVDFVAETAAEPVVEDLGTAVSSLLEPSIADDPADPLQLDPGEAEPFDENAPLAAAARFAPQPDVLHDRADASPVDREPAPANGPSWPPPGDHGVVAAPAPRTPAGAYLPPSAVLPPAEPSLGLPSVRAAAVAGAVAAQGASISVGAAAVGATAVPAAGASATDADGATTGLASRGLAGLSDLLGAPRITTSVSRRTIAMGAGLASLGLVLPWVNTLPGGNPFANYFDRWGLVGPGGWIPLAGLVGLLLVAAGWGRVASWPIGLPAIASSAFLAGLLFRYLFGGFGWAIGIWFTVVGAIVLLVGGLLDRSARHEPGDEPV